ncbi:MAG: hypothetical protein NW224_07910 [Leptolyngbyaceae cyanobacterium bins.302]|nr:hypothetical protein [Leptolyngbyaceae cyanobacterium bins.302]
MRTYFIAQLSFLTTLLGMLAVAASANDGAPKLDAISSSSLIQVDDRPNIPALEPVLAQASPPAATEVQILSPKASVTSQPFTDFIVQYATGATVQVLVNGQAIAPTTATQKQDDPATNQTRQVWYRIPLRSGENILTVQAAGASPVNVMITVKETAAKIEFLPFKEPRVPADGRSALTVEGQILDEAGQVVPKDAVVTLTASSGKFVGADYDKERPGFQVLAKQGKFRAPLQSSLDPQVVRIRAAVDRHELVTQEEVKRPTLTPPTSINPVQPASNLPYPPSNQPSFITPSPYDKTLESYTQVEFITNLRPWIVSGQANLRFGQAGLDFYNSFQDYLRPSLLDQGYRVDFSTAAFAQGRIGEWLFTGAFNNQRPLNEDCTGATRLFRDAQFCDQVYPTFGDSSTVDYLTPSIDSVYFKLERTSPVFGAGTDYAMWGDYTTREFARSSQFYTATTRQLHGFKANYNLGDLQVTMAYANNVSGFQRDTIAPNGTSGYYILSRRLVIAGSENIFLETEELLRPGTVVERKALYRGVDYEIDYDRGAILFRRNINALEFDPYGRSLRRQIVATYQYDGLGDAGKLYAGRVQYNFSRELGREIWAGFTYLREDQGAQQLEVYGGDLLVSLGKDAQLVGEVARSNYDSIFRGNIGGNAYRFELTGTIIPGLFGRGYYRSVEAGFTNNATTSFTPGQTRYGAELTARVTPTTQATVQFDREVNFGIAPAVRGITAVSTAGFGDLFSPTNEPIPGSQVDNSQTIFKAGINQKIGPVELGLDYVRRSRQDRIFPGQLEADSNQIVSRLNYAILKNLIFRVQDERNLGKTPDPLYPSRTTVGLDWLVSPDVTLRVAQQFLDNTSQVGTNSFTSFDIISDRRLTEDTTFTSRYSIINGVNGWSSQSALGLNHRIRLAPGLRLNLGYERVAADLFAYTNAGQQFAQPLASGQSAAALGLSAYTSYAIGLDYTDNPNFKANGRFEYRDGEDSGDTMVISASAAGKLSPALTALGRYQQGNFANQLLVDSGLADTINLKVGLAYRNPIDDKFNALLRYEYRQNPSTTPDTILLGSGTGSDVHLFALEALYAPNFRWEFYGKFALRSTRSYLARDLLGTNAITLGQLRTTYRFGFRWDAAAEVRWISQSVVDFDEVGLAAELGYYLNPNLRIALGYNFGSANDRDLSRTKDGVYVTLSLKLDQLFSGFGVQLPDRKVAPPQQQESLIQPVVSQPSPPTGVLPPPSTAQTAVPAQPASEGIAQ